ncbi:MAG: flagellar assembly protein FliW [Hydrogenophilus sp.]|nr:flagellar assembly protein FliW [Hydrogenophilus sp.]
MRLNSPIFGELDVSDDKVIEFPKGLPGLPGLTRFVLVHEAREEGLPRVYMLQSVDDPEVAMSLVSPDALGVRYELELTDEEVAVLQVSSPEELALAVVVRRDEESPENRGLRANFMGPILINPNSRKGLQKVLDHFTCDVVIHG